MNKENLIPFDKRTESERREIATKAGIASGKTRRENRDRKKRMQKTIDLLVRDPKTLEKLKEVGVDDATGVTYEDAMDLVHTVKAAQGDIQSYKAVKEEAYGKMDNKTELEVSGEVSGITIEVKRLDKEEG